MAGYIFALGNKSPEKTYFECAKNGVYSTFIRNASMRATVAFEGTLADYATMKPGDNVYFFYNRTVYGIGEIINIGSDCKYNNFFDACKIKHYEYSEVQNELLYDIGESSSHHRWICLFKHAPNFFSLGVDMDDILSYKPNSFRMLRAFWKLSFVKIDDEENQALKEKILLRNQSALLENSKTITIIDYDNCFHNKIAENMHDNHLINIPHLLSCCFNKHKIKHEMAIEAATLNKIATDSNTIFGSWDYLSHQVIASPFKPIDYIDKMDVFGYRFLPGTKIISKYIIIEIKKDTANIDTVTQVSKYVDWICKEYAYGDYSMIEAYILAYDYNISDLKQVYEICQRNYTTGSHPVKNEKWFDVKLVKYAYQDNDIQYTSYF